MTPFAQWWEDVGSGIAPNPGDDYETFAQRVAHAAWIAALQHVRDGILETQAEFPNE